LTVQIELSFVIPVFNGSSTIGPLVERIHELFADLDFEVVLVNDGSPDDSEQACQRIAAAHASTVSFVQLARNFGEHNAVLAGLNFSAGAAVAILDDDGQNPVEEVRRLYDHLRQGSYDVVYGNYRTKHHSWFRNLGSAFNDRVATHLLGKPRDLYLSSFKVMNRFLADEITQYRGAFPYVDGLILRVTRNLAQIDVEHRERAHGESNYSPLKLFMLWLNMFLNFSIKPLRISALLGIVTSLLSLVLLGLIIIDKIFINPNVTIGLPTVLVIITLFAGVQLVILGAIGEYLGRLFLDHSGSPQFVVRYVREREELPDRDPPR